MRIRFEVKAHIETEEGLTDEQTAAFLDELIGGLSPHEISEWMKASRYADALQTAVRLLDVGE